MVGALHLLWMISWQTAILAVLVFAVTRLGGKAPAAWRYALWIIVAAKFVVPPLLHVPDRLISRADQPYARVSRVLVPPMHITPAPVEVMMAPAPAPQVEYRPADAPKPLSMPDPIDVLGGAWVLGMSIMIVRLIRRYRRQAMLGRGSITAPDGLVTLLGECASRLHIRRAPRIWLSDSASTPMLTGLFRPTIILPACVTGVCSRSDLTAILMHELAHVRRRDMAVLWLHQIVQTVFFFHPAAWLVGRELRSERELACDELVLSTPGIERIEYAAGYLSVVKLASGASIERAALSMAESFEVEKRRLSMILDRSIPRMSAGWVVGLLLVITIGIPTFGVSDPAAPEVPRDQAMSAQEPIAEPSRPGKPPAAGEQVPPVQPAPPAVDAQGNLIPPAPTDAAAPFVEPDDGPVYRYIPKEGDIMKWDQRADLLRDAAFDTPRLDLMLRVLADSRQPGEPGNSIRSAADEIVNKDTDRAIALFKAGLRFSPGSEPMLGGLCRCYSYSGQTRLAISMATEQAKRLSEQGQPISNVVANLLRTNWDLPAPTDEFEWLWSHRERMTADDYVHVARRWADYKQLDRASEWMDAAFERADAGAWGSTISSSRSSRDQFQQQAEDRLFAPDMYELRLKWLGMQRKQARAKAVLAEAEKRHPGYPFVRNVLEIRDIHVTSWRSLDAHKASVKPLPEIVSGSADRFTVIVSFGVAGSTPNTIAPDQLAILERNITKDWGRQWWNGFRIARTACKAGIPELMPLVKWVRATAPSGTYLRNPKGRSSVEETLAGFNGTGRKSLGAAFYLASYLTAPSETSDSVLKSVRDAYAEQCWNALSTSEREQLASALKREKLNQKALAMLRQIPYAPGAKQAFAGM